MLRSRAGCSPPNPREDAEQSRPAQAPSPAWASGQPARQPARSPAGPGVPQLPVIPPQTGSGGSARPAGRSRSEHRCCRPGV